MTPRQKRRMAGVALVVLAVSTASALALSAFRENLMYFYGPSQIAQGEAPGERIIRLGGLVEEGSIQHNDTDLTVQFSITDTAHSIPVEYVGLLPDLFREGQGVVTHGRLGSDGIFRAERVLARHDENYMAPEVAAALKAAGYEEHPGEKAY
ncbi:MULTISPECIES: cytochrome c maturation protein CcmE [Ectothiorhodospira]|uniref:cytochrome c maturation protein CcmE n=1 Tax=Ectothiorhodospira TaxID=1051 RepID=UPI00046D1158|nr:MULTISPECIES: cytochrome c maturation protein CcmE [Ectothiorhodospira]MCG5493674.1 cytochrome c maturation protein CcmE [Ectothiorhodospira variabilis]MCG5497020.1 cytochrome c maturation protein CcmE [Ectothiorhodospira variabilis]MCG5503003.1 cytochrome c maturation protein CcmE [Ectothiorhodospira variabilis]MCG5506209.1 cytochrome c maturation protein CcmE [Ectothiorhodospira variabilis]MCG5525163.1 cytochrome c maturation protein CcmE [Ectothiorhodospira haloalkaliphila]